MLSQRNGNLQVGRNIRMYRVAAGMTQEELQKALGFKHKSSIGKIENANNGVSADMLLKIANVFHCTVNDLTDCPLEGKNKKESEEAKEIYAQYCEYLPYLAKCDDITRANIRLLLGMKIENESK